ncbi:MAG: DUF4114 domain-containing protein [Pseudanabaena sp. CAN_BIN31]|nr:DUF4114 domain-containing protein [Pseudanabaena sp. CAN_BIN31]
MATFNLTTGLDIPPAFLGTAADDIFNGTFNNGAVTDTWNSTDIINGGLGTDTLKITPNGVAAIAIPDSYWTNVSNLEKVVFDTTGAGAQTITAGTFFQTAFVATGIDLTTTSGGGAITADMGTFTGAVALTTTSTDGAQTLTTGSGQTTLVARSGAGAQTINTGIGLATVTAESTAGAQTVIGANLVAVTTTSTAGEQTITSTGASAVTVAATSTVGMQTINTGDGADVITATTTATNNMINSRGGNDTITILPTTTGDYTINAGTGDDTIKGGAGNDTINGEDGNDTIDGGGGNDTINGGSGNDRISGGLGADILTGGLGNDIFVINTLPETGTAVLTRDVITDFVAGQDKIDLSAIDADTSTAAIDPFTGFIASNASFTAAGQLKFLNGVLSGNTNADSNAEFTIQVDNVGTLTINDFVTAPPAISLAISPASVLENAVANLVYTFTRTGVTTNPLTVNYSVSGSATLNTDYTQTGAASFTATTGTVIFAANSATTTVTLSPTADTLFEPDETTILKLTNGTGYNISTNTPVTGTITNDDPAPVFAIAADSATEGGVINFTVTRTGNAQATQAVTVITSIGGTDTTSATDFTAKTETLSFAQGETTKTFAVQTTQDALFEGNETFTATLSAPTNGAVLSGTNAVATGTINNDDAIPVFSIAAAATTEGGVINFTVTRTGDAQANESVTVTTSIGGTDTATSNTDFTATTSTLSFAQGETTKTFAVQTTQDVIPEADETFTVTLSAPTNGATLSAANSTASGTILDDDNPRISLVVAPASVFEDAGASLVYTFTRTGVTTNPLTVNYSVNGSATLNTDYTQTGAASFTATTGTVIFAANSATATVTLSPTADTLFESDETAILKLTNGIGYNISTNTPVTGTITNDDPAPVFSIAAASSNEGGAIAFTVTRTGNAQTNQAVTVITSIAGTNTTSATDFTTKPETLSFAQDETTKTFTVQTIQDALFEGNETFTATLSTPTNGATLSTTNSIAIGTINNDDIAPVFAIAAASAKEGNAISFSVTRTGDAQASQSVTVATSIDSTDKASNADFTPKNETLTFAQGETTKIFSVQTAQDILLEGNETFTATLSNPTSGATVSSTNSSTTGTITDDFTFAKLSKGNSDIFTLVGTGTPKLKASLIDAKSNFVDEVGVFAVDDAAGKVGNFAIGDAGYSQAALSRAKILFSAIVNNPTGFNASNLTSLIESPGSNLRFYLVKNGSSTDDALKTNNFSNVLFASSSAQISDLGNGSFSFGWEDGSGTSDFKDLRITIQSSNEPLDPGTNLQGNSLGGEVLDLRFTSGLDADTKLIKADFVVNREAAYNNFVGFYKVTDANGGIDTNGDGVADITAGQSGYIQAAIRGRVSGIDLAVNNQGTASLSGVFTPDSIFAPFIIVNGTPDLLLDGNPNNDPAVYFPFLGANTDGVDHIRMLGSNVFGFEDLPNGGDRDFNDIVIKTTLTAIK